uniref:Acid phosphatase n=1 Tax=Heterosigma akashiwo TaxID=2829 RepID=A0A6S9KUC0_HETAK|mmetsp:Transcript_14369/g.22301  ORF Transcript_14369/g.22301 Transcript_14369/m.22301 type:complete len:637 (+) Transcript_14369:172-2082(+)
MKSTSHSRPKLSMPFFFFPVKSIFIALVSATILLGQSTDESRYDETGYPAYCSKNPDTRQIPPIDQALADDFELIQVQIVIRHGARTTWGDHNCWDGYTADWDCQAINVMIPVLEGADGVIPPIQYRKLYDSADGTMGAGGRGGNALGGSCMLGGLLDEGYRQHLANGRHLREAYLEGPNAIFDTYDFSATPFTKIFLQSDDQQRTAMSGQVLMSALFNATRQGTLADWHTTDYATDTFLKPEARACPRLAEQRAAALRSGPFLAYNASEAVAQLGKDLRAVFGPSVQLDDYNTDILFDCVLSNICADKPLHKDGATQELIERLIKHREKTEELVYTHQESMFAKTGMQDLVQRMKTKILQAINDEAFTSFALYSGHDSTVMPLLAALGLWDGRWGAYASLLAFELHRRKGAIGSDRADFYSRVVYNGKVIAHDKCAMDSATRGELCPVNVLLNSMAFTSERLNCTAMDGSIKHSSEGLSAEALVKGFGPTIWAVVCALCLVLGAALGAVVVLVFGGAAKKENERYHDLGDDDLPAHGDTEGPRRPHRQRRQRRGEATQVGEEDATIPEWLRSSGEEGSAAGKQTTKATVQGAAMVTQGMGRGKEGDEEEAWAAADAAAIEMTDLPKQKERETAVL